MYFANKQAPVLQGQRAQSVVLDAFGGLNRSQGCRNHEFSDMENMTGDDYPCISVRPARRTSEDFTEDGEKLDMVIADNENEASYDKGTGVRFTDALYDYYYRGEKKAVHRCMAVHTYTSTTNANGAITNRFEIKASIPLSVGMRGLVCFGNNVICYPAPAVINRAEEKERPESIWLRTCRGLSSMEDYSRISPATKSTVLFTLKATNESGTVFTMTNESPADKNSPFYNPGESTNYPSYKQLNLAVGTRLRIEKVVKTSTGFELTGDDFGAAFFVVTGGSFSDGVTLRAYTHQGTELSAPELDCTITYGDLEAGSSIFVAEMKTDANLLAVHQNRLWGTDTLGTSLYCSNATDFYDWEIDGSDAGGGYIDVPENTPWTAICEYGGYLYAFKAGKIYKVLGSTALDYSAVCLCDVGCVNHEAVCVCNSVLYFLSNDGVYAFAGNAPVKISEALGERYVWGVFASAGSKLYASLTKADGEKEFLVYDTDRHTWHKEDNFSAKMYVRYTDGLYALGEDGTCYQLEGETSDGVPFSVTTKKFFYSFDQKAISAVNLYLDMDEGSRVTVSVSSDGGAFVPCGTFSGKTVQFIPVRLKKCDEVQLRLSGVGGTRLKQMEFVLYQGGRTRR